MSQTGATSATLKESLTFDPQQGGVVTKRAKFSTRSAADAYVFSQPGYQNYKYSIVPMDVEDWHEVRMESASGSYSGSGQTTVVDDPNAPLVDAWELQPNIVEKDLMDADVSAVNSLTTAQKKEVTDAVQSSGTLPTFGSSTQTTLAKLLVAGVRSVRIFAPVLRRTRLVRRDYTVKDALTNVGSVIAAASFTNYEAVPAILLFSLPAGGTVTRDSLTLKYGWYKKYPAVTQVSGGQWQLVQEWEYGLWSNDLYTILT